MSSERAFLIASVDALLIAEPTVESRAITDGEFKDVAQLVLEAYPGSPGKVRTLEVAVARLEQLHAGETGEPRRDAWRGIWEGSGPPVSIILCTTWRGMPYIAQLATAPAARERGFASSLVREFAQQVSAEGGTHIGLMLKHGNPSMSLFRELGFVEMFTPAGL